MGLPGLWPRQFRAIHISVYLIPDTDNEECFGCTSFMPFTCNVHEPGAGQCTSTHTNCAKSQYSISFGTISMYVHLVEC